MLSLQAASYVSNNLLGLRSRDSILRQLLTVVPFDFRYWYWGGRERSVIDFQLVDAASRGPVGSAYLLCHPTKWGILSIGTLLTIAALFMEPSLQLMLSYSTPSVVTGSSSIPRSVYFDDVFIRESDQRDRTLRT